MKFLEKSLPTSSISADSSDNCASNNSNSWVSRSSSIYSSVNKALSRTFSTTPSSRKASKELCRSNTTCGKKPSLRMAHDAKANSIRISGELNDTRNTTIATSELILPRGCNPTNAKCYYQDGALVIAFQ